MIKKHKNKTQQIPIMKKHGWTKDDQKIHLTQSIEISIAHGYKEQSNCFGMNLDQFYTGIKSFIHFKLRCYFKVNAEGVQRLNLSLINRVRVARRSQLFTVFVMERSKIDNKATCLTRRRKNVVCVVWTNN